MAVDEGPARRGSEVRCPVCVRFKPERGACPWCGCGELPAEHFGAARTLLHAGVDRFALLERVAALDPRQAELMELHYAEQWAQAQLLIKDVRRCEAHLLQEGFVEEEQQRLAAMLPVDPASLAEVVGPLEGFETLGDLFRQSPSWDVRRLAALALVHQGELSPQIVYQAQSALAEEGRVGVEAMLALSRWRVWRRVRLGREGWTRVRELARKALGEPGLTSRAAVAWVRASGDEAPEVDVLFALRQGLIHPDPDVRFECALCLQDEVGLMAALDSADPKVVSEARRALTSLKSGLLFTRLAREGGTAFAQDVVNALPRPAPDEAMEALLSASERGPDRLTDALLELIRGQPFAEFSAAARDRWCTWAASVLPELPGEAALRFLYWAGTPPVVPESVRPFVEATAEALAREPVEVRARHLEDTYVSRLLALAGPKEEALVNRWAREAPCAPPLTQALMTLTSRIQDWREPRGKAARVLMAVWSGPGREALLEPLQKAVRDWSGIVGRIELVEAVWDRFQRYPEERAELLSVFTPWRQELWERQLASPDDALTRFKIWWRVDPEGFARQADMLVQEAPVAELAERVRGVFSAAEEVVTAQPWIASLAVFYAAAALANAFRAGADALTPEVERFLEWFPAFEQRVLATPGEKDRRAPQRPFLEELHTEESLMRRHLEAAREAEDRKWQQEMQQRVAESRRRDQERRARAAEREAEEARRAAEEAQQAAEAQRIEAAAALANVGVPSLVEVAAPPRVLSPRIASKPLDHEIIFPGLALPTLMDYVRLMKHMSQGEPLKAMAAVGLDISTWPPMATAWGQVMMKRWELGQRFGELMSAPWE